MRAHGGLRRTWRRLERSLSLPAKVLLGVSLAGLLAVLVVDARTTSVIRDQFARAEAQRGRQVAALIEAEYDEHGGGSLNTFLADVQAAMPDVRRIRVYAYVNGVPTILASSEAGEAGRPQPASQDIRVIDTGRGLQEEEFSEDLGERVLETVEPLRSGGRPVAAIEVYTSVAQRDQAAGLLSSDVRTIVTAGALAQALAFAALFAVPVVRRARRMSRAAAAVAGGDLDIVLPHSDEAPGRDELAQVAHQFQRMVGALTLRAREQELAVAFSTLVIADASHDMLCGTAVRSAARDLGARVAMRAGASPGDDLIAAAPGENPLTLEDAALVAPVGPGGRDGVLLAGNPGPRISHSDARLYLENVAETLGWSLRHQRDRRELEAAEVRFRRLVESVPAITYIRSADADAAPAYVSPQVEDVLGYPPHAWIDTPSLWLERMHPADRAATQDALQHHQREGGPLERDYRMIAADGSVHWLHDTAVLVRDGDGRPAYSQGVVTDITDAVRLSEQLREAKEGAERANRAKSQFLSRMSHELRTPLNAVLGFAQLMEMSELDDADRESVGHIRKAGGHLLTLIDEVLQISRIEAGELTLSVEPVVLGPILDDVHQLVTVLARDAGVEITIDPGTADAVVAADAQRLKQVLLNLAGNAVKYNHPGGSVTIAAHIHDAVVRIDVTDTGPGIHPEDLERVFTPFDRLDAEISGVEGTGLGLPLSRAFAEAMGGTLGVASTPGQGSTFWLRLPQAAESSLPARPSQGDTAQDWDQRIAGRLLYVEDNASNLRLIEQLMARFPGVRLVTATDGGAGLRAARERPPDMVLLDLNLPDMHGEEVLRELRADQRTRDVPAVVLSADATAAQMQRLRDAGAAGYLTKPVDVSQLIAVLSRHLPGIAAPGDAS